MIKLFGIKPALKELKGITRDFRVSWMLEELNLNYEFVVLDPQKGETQTPEYLKLNPTGKVPTLSDGEFSIFESSAICSYLAHKEKKLIPEQETPEKKFGLQNM
ncbi:MAG: glutathione S-transferase [Bdellovibrionales bacterium]|nr:glutathione S-transferase [Bdellovibrionales bacterium]